MVTVMPRVSVIINCYNGEKYLREAIQSVYDQTFADWEIVFWDDASGDASAEIAKSFDDRLRYFKGEKALSLGQARNRALEKTLGEYIAFLDQDDIWLPDKLQKQTEILDKKQDVALVYTNYFKLKPNNKKYPGYRKLQPEGNVFEGLLYYYAICISTVMVRKDAFLRLDSLFDETMNLAEETDVFMRILYNAKASYIAEPLSVYRIHAGMSTFKYIDRYPEEITCMVEKFKKLDSEFTERYKNALKYYEAKLGYWHARAAIAKGSAEKARTYLSPYKTTDYRFFILYLSTYVSPRLWKIIHDLKDKLVFGGG
jgi:glycosyltransferase involved in cell wall biosynthesis